MDDLDAFNVVDIDIELTPLDTTVQERGVSAVAVDEDKQPTRSMVRQPARCDRIETRSSGHNQKPWDGIE